MARSFEIDGPSSLLCGEYGIYTVDITLNDNEWFSDMDSIVWNYTGADEHVDWDEGETDVELTNYNRTFGQYTCNLSCSGVYYYYRMDSNGGIIGSEQHSTFSAVRKRVTIRPWTLNENNPIDISLYGNMTFPNEMLSTETLHFVWFPVIIPIQWTDVITNSFSATNQENKFNFSITESKTEGYMTYKNIALGVDDPQYITFTVGTNRGSSSCRKRIIVKPSLTGIEVSPSGPVRLDINNNFTQLVTCTPLPYGTGAPVKYKYELLNPAFSNNLTFGTNFDRYCTCYGNISNISSVGLRCTAYLEDGNLSFYKDIYFNIRPKWDISDGGYRKGELYLYDGGYREVVEIYVYDGGFRQTYNF